MTAQSPGHTPGGISGRKPGRKPGKHAVSFVFITVLIDMIGFGMIMPVMPQLLKELTGLEANAASVLGAWLMVTYAGMQLVFAPIIGGLSDRFGRKPVLLAALAGFAINYLVMGLASVFWLLFIGRLLSGVFGASYATANAYIADITPPEQRAARFGLVGAAFGLGYTLGPVMGGFLGETFGPRAPFFFAAGLAGLNLVYGLIVLPETLTRENRRAFDWRRANPLGSLLQIRKYPAVFGLMSAVFAMMVAHSVFPAVWTYYADFRYGWDAGDIGLSLMMVGLCTALVMGGLTRILVPRLGERRSILLSLGLGAAAYAAYGLAQSGWVVYGVIMVGALVSIGQPVMQGAMSRLIPADSQGELQGAMTAMQSLSMVIGPLIMSRLFFAFSGEGAGIQAPGAPFFLSAVLTLIALAIALFAGRKHFGVSHEGDDRPASGEAARKPAE